MSLPDRLVDAVDGLSVGEFWQIAGRGDIADVLEAVFPVIQVDTYVRLVADSWRVAGWTATARARDGYSVFHIPLDNPTFEMIKPGQRWETGPGMVMAAVHDVARRPAHGPAPDITALASTLVADILASRPWDEGDRDAWSMMFVESLWLLRTVLRFQQTHEPHATATTRTLLALEYGTETMTVIEEIVAGLGQAAVNYSQTDIAERELRAQAERLAAGGRGGQGGQGPRAPLANNQGRAFRRVLDEMVAALICVPASDWAVAVAQIVDDHLADHVAFRSAQPSNH